MNEHAKTRERLAALVAGTLARKEETTLRAHLAACPECARQEKAWRSLVRAVERVPETAPTPGRLARITARAAAHREEVLEQRRNRLLLVSLALYGWAWTVLAWPLFTRLAEGLAGWLGWAALAGTVGTVALWWAFTLTIGLALLPLLRQWKQEAKEKAI